MYKRWIDWLNERNPFNSASLKATNIGRIVNKLDDNVKRQQRYSALISWLLRVLLRVYYRRILFASGRCSIRKE